MKATLLLLTLLLVADIANAACRTYIIKGKSTTCCTFGQVTTCN